jgi:hypothetical protein
LEKENDREVEQRLPQSVEKLSNWPESAFNVLEDEILYEPDGSKSADIENISRKRVKVSLETFEGEDEHESERKQARIGSANNDGEKSGNCSYYLNDTSIK